MNQQVQQTALYSYSEEDYTMPISALGEIEVVQITYNKYSMPLELTFKDKTYKIGGSTVDLGNSNSDLCRSTNFKTNNRSKVRI